MDGRELDQGETTGGYEAAVGTIVPVSDEGLDALPLSTAKAFETVAFVSASSVGPIQIGACYYLASESTVKLYELLRQALGRSSKVVVAEFAVRDRERLGLLRVVGWQDGR
ncbi:Ku protein [Streptomyces sp. LARHCF249]